MYRPRSSVCNQVLIIVMTGNDFDISTHVLFTKYHNGHIEQPAKLCPLKSRIINNRKVSKCSGIQKHHINYRTSWYPYLLS